MQHRECPSSGAPSARYRGLGEDDVGGVDDSTGAGAPLPRRAENKAEREGVPPPRKQKPKKKRKNSDAPPQPAVGIVNARKLAPDYPPPGEAPRRQPTTPDAVVEDAARNVLVAYLRRGREAHTNLKDGGGDDNPPFSPPPPRRTGIRRDRDTRNGGGGGGLDACERHLGTTVFFEFGAPRSGGDGTGTDGVYNRILRDLNEPKEEGDAVERQRPRPGRRPETIAKGDDDGEGDHPSVVGGGANPAAGDDVDLRHHADADVVDRAFASWLPRGAQRPPLPMPDLRLMQERQRQRGGGGGGGDSDEENEWAEEAEEEDGSDSDDDDGPISGIRHRHHGRRHRDGWLLRWRRDFEGARDRGVGDDGDGDGEPDGGSIDEEEEDSDDDRPISQLHRHGGGSGGGEVCRGDRVTGRGEEGADSEDHGDGIGNGDGDSDSDDNLPISQLHSRARDLGVKCEAISEHQEGREQEQGGRKKNKRSRNIVALGSGDEEDDVDDDDAEDNIGDGGEHDDDDEDDEDYEDDGDYSDDDDDFEDDVVPMPRLGPRKKVRRGR